MTRRDELTLNSDEEIICPECGFDHVHQKGISSSDGWASLQFWCESCHSDMDLVFKRHKGRTVVYWS